jgi:hypothetical protein
VRQVRKGTERRDSDRFSSGSLVHLRRTDYDSNESIPSPRQRLDESRQLRGVLQSFPQPLHGLIKAMLEIHKRAGGPQSLDQLFAGYQVARALQEQREHQKWLLLQVRFFAIFLEFPGPQIQFELTEADLLWQKCRGRHPGAPGSAANVAPGPVIVNPTT